MEIGTFLFQNCILIKNGAIWCKLKTRRPRSRHPVAGESIERLSISVSGEDKAALAMLATEKKVSLAWVIRDAVDRYLKTEVPKLQKKTGGSPANVPPQG